MRKIKVLIAEWEQKNLEDILNLLDKENYEVIKASDGVEALQLALQNVPDFIMLSLDLPLIDGVKLSQILRTNPRTEGIPIFYMNDKAIQLSHFRRNIDYFIIKPFNKDELKKILSTVRKKILNVYDKRFEEEFAGNLKQMGLPDLIQILTINKRTGNLYIYETQKKDNILGVVVLNEGRIINAKSGNTKKTKAFYRILNLKEGYFSFIPGEPSMAEEIFEGSDSLIMEGLRQIDEFIELRNKIPKDAKIHLKIKSTQLPNNLRPITKEVLTAIEIFPDINDLIDNVDATDYEILKILNALWEKGIIKFETAKREETFVKTSFSSDVIIELKRKLAKTFFDIRWTNNIYLLFFMNDNTPAPNLLKFLNCINFESNRDNVLDLLNSRSKMGYMGKVKLVESLLLHLFYFSGIAPTIPLWESVLKNSVGAVVIGKRDIFREIIGYLGRRYVVIEEKDLNNIEYVTKSIEKIFESFIIMEEK
ncbi:MAG: DUF4388 domain-containing protein [Proteobacteria bacterium]|nr:DUF4388 domain-containing protein [Pseudomonadota bacterium]